MPERRAAAPSRCPVTRSPAAPRPRPGTCRSPQRLTSLRLAEWHAVRRPRATRTPTAHAFRDPVSVFCPRPAIMRHDPGLAASPPVRYILKVERSAYSPFSVVVRCGPSTSPPAGAHPLYSVHASCCYQCQHTGSCGLLPRPARGRDDLMTIADWAPRHVRPYIEATSTSPNCSATRCARRSPSTASCAATPRHWSGAPAPRPRGAHRHSAHAAGLSPGRVAVWNRSASSRAWWPMSRAGSRASWAGIALMAATPASWIEKS